MAVSEFAQRILDRIVPVLGDVSAGPMFGGYRLYRNDKIFGCIMHDQVYLKADDQTKDTFLAAGARQMTNDVVPTNTTRRMAMPKYSVVLDIPDVADWLQCAVAAADRAPVKKRKGR